MCFVSYRKLQKARFEYNSKGKTIRATDPVGRETVYVYGTGSTPDADQANGTGIDLLSCVAVPMPTSGVLVAL